MEKRVINERTKMMISILVVEDEPEILKQMELMLGRIAQSVLSATNGVEAYDIYRQEPIDLIISDIDMPRMNGLELLKSVRNHDRKIPFILLTGLKSLDILTEAIQYGITAFLSKPINIKDLIAKIEEVAQVKMLEKQLLREQTKLNTILNHVDSIVVMVSTTDKLLFVNQKFFDSFPYESYEHFRAAHECICDLFETSEGYMSAYMGDTYWVQYMLNHPAHIHNVKMRDKFGDEKIYSVSLQTLEESDDLYVITLSDVTELQNAKEEANEAAKMKGEFLANMSHEIRTPMNGILGFTSLLAQSGLNEKQQHYLDIINNSTETLLAIINDILDFSKLENGKLELELLPHNPIMQMHKVGELFSARMEEKQIRYTVEIDPEIGTCLYIDLLRVQQIISNLLTNALKFTPDGGSITFYVHRLDTTDSKVRLRIGVSDTGIGIAPEKQQKIFEAFSQADTSTTRHFGGTGLGLSISSFLVNLMGGTLHVESMLNEGSTFYFEFDAEECHAQIDIPPAKNSFFKEDCSFQGNILIAEDNLTNQLLIEEYMRMYGIECLIVENGQKAVEAALNESFDLILMDINMPILSGSDAMKKLHELSLKTPIVALTANAMSGDKERFLNEGFDGYLSKPIIQSELESVLSTYLKSSAKSFSSLKSFNDTISVPEYVLLNLPLLKTKLPFPEPVIQKLLRSFLENSEKSLERLHNAIEDGDPENIRQAAHSLKGILGNLHVESMHLHAQEMEYNARENKLSQMHSSFQLFQKNMRSLQQEISHYLESTLL